MIEINEDFLTVLRERFYNCGDGVITKINISYEKGSVHPTVTLAIETKDSSSPTSWSILNLILNEVTDIRLFKESKYCFHIISDGMFLNVEKGFFEIGFEEDFEVEYTDIYFKFTNGFWYIDKV